MLDATRQTSSGNQSPNVSGDGNTFSFLSKDKLANEVTTMLNVITLIPEIARERGVTSDTIEYPKDFLKKIDERFNAHAVELKSRFSSLDLLYRSCYDDAKRNAGIDEFGFQEMCSYLRNLSMEMLKSNGDNPLESLKALCNLFENKFSLGADKNFSVEAIEYFLYKQLVECNVFPNPLQE